MSKNPHNYTHTASAESWSQIRALLSKMAAQLARLPPLGPTLASGFQASKLKEQKIDSDPTHSFPGSPTGHPQG